MKTLLLITFLFLGYALNAQQYSRVKIYTDSQGLQQLAELGLPVDHGTYKKNTFFISDFSSADIFVMDQNGFSYEILIDDVQAYYAERNKNGDSSTKNVTCPGTSGSGGALPAVPVNFDMNPAYAGYYKYNDMLLELDAMAAQYPNLITVKTQISNYSTHQGRPMYHVKISDNPNVEEAEPEVLYTAIHHAREPMSMSQTIFYMWYLLENYGTNPEVTYLVDNTEMYFVPCINPDGYVRNETNNPSGFGMHRKNMNPAIGSNNPGVDLNRNYSYGWNTTGVSANQNNDTYPGTSAFSEPETQAMKWLMENHNFVSAFNAHTYGNTLLHPIGTTSAEFADHHDYFTDLTAHMTSQNGYFPQKSSGLYPASGDSDDYEYKVDIGVGQKDTVFAMTPEIGSDFWPASNQIVPTCQDMVFTNMVLSHMAHKYLITTDTDPSTVTTLSGNFNHGVQRLGLENGPVTVSIDPLLNIQSVGSPVIYDINLRATSTGAISYVLPGSIQFGDEIKYVLKTDNGLFIKRDTITKTYGAITLQAFEDGSSTTNWTGNWSTTTNQFYSPSASYTDSPTGNYSNNTTRTYQFSQSIDLTNATSAMVSFYAKWAIEADYDYCQFQVSTNGGGTWTGQCGLYTVNGTSANGSAQPNNQPVYEGTQSSWVREEISLSDYIGQTIQVRFILESDGGVTDDGFYFDDFSVNYNQAGAPTAPTANFSTSNTTICEGETVAFNDFSSGVPTSWAWTFGDGGSSTMQSPSYTYTTSGQYDVTLTVTNAQGTDTYVQSNYITVIPGTSSTQNLTICEGESVSVGSNNYTQAGTYTDVIANSIGCDSTITTNLTVNPAPAVTIASDAPNNTTCVNYDLITLTASPVGGTFTGPGVTGSQFDPSVAGVGNHTITYSYTESTNGCTGTTTLSLTVEACASLGEIDEANIELYPNPNTGEFNISGLVDGQTFVIYDANGRIVKEGKAGNGDVKIDIHNESIGTYYFKTTHQTQEIEIPFVITK